MKNYKEILKSKTILEVLNERNDSPRRISRTPSTDLYSHDHNTDHERGSYLQNPGNSSQGQQLRQNTRGGNVEVSGRDFNRDHFRDFNANDVSYTKPSATPYIVAGAGTYGAWKGGAAAIGRAKRTARLAKNVIATGSELKAAKAAEKAALEAAEKAALEAAEKAALEAAKKAALAPTLRNVPGSGWVFGDTVEAGKALDKGLEAGKALDKGLEAGKALDTGLEAGKALDTGLEAGKALGGRGLEAGKALGWNIAKTGMKTGSKAFMRALPWAGAAVDLGFAANDISQGKYGRGLARGALGLAGFIPILGTGINLIGNTLIDALWEHHDTSYYQNKLIERLDDKRYSKYMLSE